MLVGVARGLSKFLWVRFFSWRWETLFDNFFGYGEGKLTWGEKLCVFGVFSVRYELSFLMLEMRYLYGAYGSRFRGFLRNSNHSTLTRGVIDDLIPRESWAWLSMCNSGLSKCHCPCKVTWQMSHFCGYLRMGRHPSHAKLMLLLS